MADELIELVDGASSNDAIVKKRWRRNIQRSVNVLWNDRPWTIKLKTDSFTYTPGTDNPLPATFGNFENKGCGIYCRSPRATLRPMDIGELKMMALGSTVQTQAFGPWTRWSVDNEDDAPTLKLWYEPPSAVTFDIVYMKRAPVCQYDEIDEGTDELFWFPDKWGDLIMQGAQWFNSHDVHSNQETAEQALLKLGLDSMRERENWLVGKGGQVLPYRRGRYRAS